MTIVEKTTRAGRPRAIPDATPGLPPREQILLAAAELFVNQGFGSTSTRAIADAVGMRQASLYYHFAGKDDILAELLERSVRPSTDLAVRLLDQAGADPRACAAALYALAASDTALLSRAPHNIGSLYLIPEARDPRFDAFRAQRDELQQVYGRLGHRARALAPGSDDTPEPLLAALLMQTVEVVITLRQAGMSSIEASDVARSALRLIGLNPTQVRAAAADAGLLT
jgi:AcrR family transcriptional regulator